MGHGPIEPRRAKHGPNEIEERREQALLKCEKKQALLIQLLQLLLVLPIVFSQFLNYLCTIFIYKAQKYTIWAVQLLGPNV